MSLDKTVKLLMLYDIKQGRDQDYFEFQVREWIPGMTKLGIEPIGAWFTMYSSNNDKPQIMAEALADDVESLRDILQSDEWEKLHDGLMEYVDNFERKVVHLSGGFQL